MSRVYHAVVRVWVTVLMCGLVACDHSRLERERPRRQAEPRRSAAPAPQAVQPSVELTTGPNLWREPPGYRAFDRPGGKLPPRLDPPEFASPDAACPVGMNLVDGLRCSNPVQECLGWVDPPGKPNRACVKFRSPSRCDGPKHALRYCIDRLEYTPEGWERPLVHVSWNEGSRLCLAQHKRLCTETEWEFACEGPEALPYPHGYTRDGARCNHDLDELFTARGKLIDRRVAADARPDCKSPFGVLNMVGNVDEWTTRTEPGARPSILRGGWWLVGRNRCRAATASHGPIYAGPQTGFRCCKPARKP